ncbi:unnamed protein product [Sympodiomycopsis kandeliae]
MSSTTADTNTGTSLLDIAGVTASQLIGPSASPQPLASGTLSLLQAAPSEASNPVLLVIKVDEAVFPLYKDTVMGTHDGKEEWYTFSLSLAEGEKSWVRLVLPPLSTPELVKSRDAFEQHLIARGLLLDGIRAAGDEIGQSSAQSGSQTASSITQSSAAHQVTTAPTASPWKFSRLSHSVSEGLQGSSSTLAGYTSAASQAISGLATSAGQVAGNAFQSAKENIAGAGNSTSDGQQQSGDTRVMPDTRDAMYDAFSGAGQGLSDVSSSVTTEAPRMVNHELGPEAKKIASEASQGVKNVGQAGADLTLGTSTVFHGAKAAEGAVKSSSDQP